MEPQMVGYRGAAGYAQMNRVEAEQKNRMSASDWPDRFYQKVGEATTLVVLDEDPIDDKDDTRGPFFVWEHCVMPPGGKKGIPKFYTCRADYGTCPLCEGGNQAYFAMVHSILNTKGVTRKGKDGKEDKNSGPIKQLLVMKTKARAAWNMKRPRFPDNGKAHYALVEFMRMSTEDGAAGRDIEFKKYTSYEKLAELCPDGLNPKEWLEPIDFMEAFALRPEDELRVIAREAGYAVPGPAIGSDAHTSQPAHSTPPPAGAVSDQSIDSIL